MDKKINDIKNNKMVDPATYGKDYYIHAYAGDVDKYLADLNDLPVSLASCFGLAKPRPKERVLDIGCGRGHLSYWCVINGCLVTAIDYNSDAIELTKLAMEKLPKELQANVVVKQQDIKTIDTSQKYDVIFMADLVEHLYDWELNVLFDKIKEILTRKTGRLLIHTTPNAIWIRYIYPLKRILNFPTTLRKKNNFFYKRDRYSYDTAMHVNEQTPKKLKKFLRSKGFKAKVWCDDGSSNFISLLTKKFAGSDIWAIAKI